MENRSGFEFLDGISLVSFMAQLQNMEEDDRRNLHLDKIIDIIFSEIQKLHQENDVIMEKLDLLLKKKER